MSGYEYRSSFLLKNTANSVIDMRCYCGITKFSRTLIQVRALGRPDQFFRPSQNTSFALTVQYEQELEQGGIGMDLWTNCCYNVGTEKVTKMYR
ncbi:hypothetical protein NPIL_278411 [Nephila pilipes]|uniref:Uncharacterized protein n=1 Tax=Nephila pilipes TaxID=299642 RepID=A0A8X6NS03_NEPPI|nr:hypothetical protein NPIL_278411 [Nephila pilipes]